MKYFKPGPKLLKDFKEQVQAVDGSVSTADEDKAFIENFIRNYGFDISVVGIKRGLITTIYEIKLEKKTRFKDIQGLKADLKLELKTRSLTISQATKKSTVNLEVPVLDRPEIPVKRVITSPAFSNFKGALPVALGLDINNNEIVFDIAKMPHLLIAGTTGSGKSVCLNVVLLSLIYSRTPDDLKIVLIDPKCVEFSLYSNIPFLLHKTVHEADESRKVIVALVEEMEKRYILLQSKKCRDISAYNTKIPGDRLPRIVVIIDEFADLIMQKKETEEPICRLAQKGRAAGIHLIIATQRPSVDVITGTIKANFPSRIAFQTSSGVDSKVVLDTIDAEDLVGKGDFLFKDNTAKGLVRGQCCFVNDDEVGRVTRAINVKDRDIPTLHRPPEKPEKEVKKPTKHKEKVKPEVKRKPGLWSKFTVYCVSSFKEYSGCFREPGIPVRIIFSLLLFIMLVAGFNFEKIIHSKNRFFNKGTDRFLVEGKYLPEVKKIVLKAENDGMIHFTSFNGDLYIIRKNELNEDVIATDGSFYQEWKDLGRAWYRDIRIISKSMVLSTEQVGLNETHIFAGSKKSLFERKLTKLTHSKCLNRFPSFWGGKVYFVSNRRGKLSGLFFFNPESGKQPELIKFPYNVEYAGIVRSGILPLEAENEIFVYDLQSNLFYDITRTADKEYSPSAVLSGKFVSYIRKREDGTSQILLYYKNTGETKVLALPDINDKDTFVRQMFIDNGSKLYLLTKNRKYRLYEIKLKKK